MSLFEALCLVGVFYLAVVNVEGIFHDCQERREQRVRDRLAKLANLKRLDADRAEEWRRAWEQQAKAQRKAELKHWLGTLRFEAKS